MAELTVTQRKSRNGANQKQLDTLRSLGLRRIGHTVAVKDSEQARGMLHAVRHLVEGKGGKALARATRSSRRGSGCTACLQRRAAAGSASASVVAKAQARARL